MLGTKGVMQVGWATNNCHFSQEKGVGKAMSWVSYFVFILALLILKLTWPSFIFIIVVYLFDWLSVFLQTSFLCLVNLRFEFSKWFALSDDRGKYLVFSSCLCA